MYSRMSFFEQFVYLDSSWTPTVLIFVLTFCLMFYTTRRPAGIPPGPALFPVIGNLHSFAGNIFSNLDSLRQKHGDVYSLYLGNELMVFLNGYDVIQEALVKKGSVFKWRPNSVFDQLAIKDPAIVYANGALWKEQRMFALKALQELCFKDGGTMVEKVVLNEVDHLGKTLEQISYPADIEHYINISITNVMGMFMYNHRFDYEDKELRKVLQDIRENVNNFMYSHTLTNCLPFLRFLPFDILGLKSLRENSLNTLAFFRVYMEQLKKEHTDDSRSTMVDLYMIHQKEMAAANTSTTCTDYQMEFTLYDLVLAGSETTATTIRWILAYLIHYPETQDKMFAEIQSRIGGDQPKLSDRKRLPFSQAVILEVTRLTSVAPLAIPHSVEKDTCFRDYKIPRCCSVMINISSSNKDPASWNNPEDFIPERFLNDDGTEVVTPKEFIPFSLGPRSCPGETLARFELFLMVTSLVQKFRFLAESDDNVSLPTGNLGLTWCPEPHKIRVVKR